MAYPALEVRVERDVVLVPRNMADSRHSGAGVMQRIDGQWRPVTGTRLRRRGQEMFDPPEPPAVEPVREFERAFFAGYLFNHYGHFVLESLARMWPGSPEQGIPIIWLARTAKKFRPWMRTIVRRIGVKRKLALVDARHGPTRVRELIIPDPGFVVGELVHPAYAQRLAWHQAERTGSKLWLSRQNLGELSGLAEEAELEAVLARHGWQSVRLEDHSIEEQARILGGAAHIAGIEGSAFHTLMFVRGYQGTIDILTRHNNTNFDLIARTYGWNQVRHQMVGGHTEQIRRGDGPRGGMVDIRHSGIDVEATAALILRRTSRFRGWSLLRRRARAH